MHLVAEFSPRAVLAGQRDAAIIGVEIFAAPDKMLGESILKAAAHDQSGPDLLVPDSLLQGIAPLLDRIAVAVADAGEADADRTISQQAVERVACAQPRGAERVEARQQCTVAEDQFVPRRRGFAPVEFAADHKAVGKLMIIAAIDADGETARLPLAMTAGTISAVIRGPCRIRTAAVNARIEPGPVVLRRRQVRNTNFSSLRHRTCQ